MIATQPMCMVQLTRLHVPRDSWIAALTAAGHDILGPEQRADPGTVDLAFIDGTEPEALEQFDRLSQADTSLARIVVTRSGQQPTATDWLDRGADDVVLETIHPTEMVARVEAVVAGRRRAPIILRAGLAIDLGRRVVRRGDESVALSPIEVALLSTLVEADGSPVSRAELLAKVWGMSFDPGTKLVEVAISRLRQKLVEPGVVRTVPGQGYLLN